jgi:hypothetical protein
MSEAWALGLLYTITVVAVGAAWWWGAAQYRRAELAEADVDAAYLDGFDDGQHDRVIIHQDWPPRPCRSCGRADCPAAGLPYVDRCPLWQAAEARADRGEYLPTYPAGQLALPGVDGDQAAEQLDGETAAAVGWLAELRVPEPATDERLERIVLPLAETDTAWLQRIEDDQAAAWSTSPAVVDQLADIYYRILKERDK